jgi:serine/threonine-protein kinase
MGIVYRGRDETLDRPVALKVLVPDALVDQAARARFRDEALALSRLNHPNICTIYEVGEADGQTFLAMEYIEGQPLSAITSSHALPPDVVVRYGHEFADALGHAHARGVVHRDVKSANVMVTPEGRIKVLDFGLARRVSQPEDVTRAAGTEVGAVVGTLSYMAPEVLRGRRGDVSSDVWSLGVVLFEMASGTLPFRGRTGFEVSGAILHGPTPRIGGAGFSAIQAVIDRCLEKEPARRYASGGEVRAALEAIRTISVAPSVPSRADDGRSVVVLPLENLSGDLEQAYLVDGLHEALITDLARLSGLRVVARASSLRYKASERTLEDIARELNVGAVLTGSVVRAGTRVRVTAQLIEPATHEHLWAERYDREFRDVLSLQDDIVAAIATRVRLRLNVSAAAGRRQVNPEAHEAYLKGRFHYLKQTAPELTTAGEYFQLALQRDPDYAPAHAGVANVWLARGDRGFLPPHEAFPKAKAAAERALELDASIAEPHMALGNLNLFVEWDWATAEREFKRAIELNPSYVEAYLGYTHLLVGLRRFDEWQVHIQRVIELDPLNFLVPVFYGTHLIAVGRRDEAIASLRRALEMQPGFSGAHLGLWTAFHRSGLTADALVEARSFFEAIGDREAAACVNEPADDTRYEDVMLRIAATLTARAERANVPAIRIARVFAHARADDQTLFWLWRAYERHEGPLGYIAAGPEWDHLRGHPQFRDLLLRMNLPGPEP